MINIKSQVTRVHLTICSGTLSFPYLENEHFLLEMATRWQRLPIEMWNTLYTGWGR